MATSGASADNERTLDRNSFRDVDRETVARVLEGDEVAFEELVAKYHPRVFRLVHRIIDDWQRSEDVCQEVFVKVFLKLGDFKFRSRLSTWIFRVAVNTALRARGRAARTDFQPLEGDGPAPLSRGEAGVELDLEGRDLIGKLLRPLPPHLRVAVWLKETEGLTYRELAGVLGCSEGAVEQRLHRAFRRLREIWKDRAGELGIEGV